jgi:hypothetical protein
MTTVQSESSQSKPGPLGWVKAHLVVMGGATAAVVVVIAIIVAVVVISGSSDQGKAVAPGAIVGTAPLTSGYRLSGKIVKHSAATILVDISRVDSSAGEARNIVIRQGAQIEFDTPADGPVALARNGHEITSPLKLHDGDQISLVGQFTSVVVPPAPAHDGYAFIGVEASSK